MHKLTGAIISLFLVASAVVSCSHESDKAAISRLDKVTYLYPQTGKAERERLLDSLRPQLSALIRVTGIGEEADDSTVMIWAESYPVRVFTPMTDSIFSDLEWLEKSLGNILKRAGDAGLELPRRSYAAVVWGSPKSVVFDDSVALIALNHYLGSESPAYAGWPEYRRQLKNASMLPYDITEASVATAYPYRPARLPEGTVLSRMLYEGALAYAKIALIKDAKDNLAMGFTPQQFDDIVANRKYTWNKLATGKLLYSTDPELHARLFSLLPHSTPLSARAPGRALRYTGLEIVRSYIKTHPDVTLRYLLSPEFYNGESTLRDAGYRP